MFDELHSHFDVIISKECSGDEGRAPQFSLKVRVKPFLFPKHHINIENHLFGIYVVLFGCPCGRDQWHGTGALQRPNVTLFISTTQNH